jgi:hypothetical protein
LACVATTIHESGGLEKRGSVKNTYALRRPELQAAQQFPIAAEHGISLG